MAKKKSKTQKYKKNLKKKQQKLQKSNQKNYNQNNKQTNNQTPKQKQLVSKDNVKYNVVLNKEIDKSVSNSKQKNAQKQQQTQNNKKNKQIEQNIRKEVLNNKKETTKNKFTKSVSAFINNLKKKISDNQKFKKVNTEKKQKISHKIEKEIKKSIPKTKTEQEIKKKNIIIRLFYEINKNSHIIFNTLIIITFIILLVGLIRINVFKSGTIVYICSITLFLMLVAISYNKYLSGKIFTLLITAVMCIGIYFMQYTYDFIRNLNSNVYEYKTYYVVTFDTAINRSIYTINNKKVGLLKDNCINIERKLNTKLDKVHYIEYDNINDLYTDFYSSKFKAILVNENQYKYLKNNIHENSRNVKILYEFKANAKK
jgi:hypothetical protein